MTGLIGGPFPAQQGGGAFEIGFQLRFEHWGVYALTGLFHPSYRLTRGAFETAPPS